MSESKKSPLWLRGLFWLLLSCALVLALCVFRAEVLTGLARAWIVNDPATNANAVVVLGGGLEFRPFAAAQFYREGRADRILIARSELPPSAQMGLTTPEFDTAREVLVRKGVPTNAIELLGRDTTSTWDEAHAFRDWVQSKSNHVHTVLLPTDLFHTRRVRWIFTKTLRSTGANVRVVAVAPPHYTANDWWQHEEGIVAFQNEVIKFAVYLLKY